MANVEESDVAAECEYRKEKGVAKWHEKFLVEYRGGRKTEGRKCIKCNVLIKSIGASTTSMTKHTQVCDSKTVQTVIASDQTVIPFKRARVQDGLNEVAKLVYEDNIPVYKVVRSPTLQSFFKQLHFSKVTYCSVNNALEVNYQTAVQKIKDLIVTRDKRQMLSLSFDKWTSADNKKFIGVYLYVGGESVCLGLIYYTGFCGAEEILINLKKTLSRFGLQLRDISLFISDCGSDVQLAGRIANVFTFPCLAHVINLIVKQFICNVGNETENFDEEQLNALNSDCDSDNDDDENDNTFETMLSGTVHRLRELCRKIKKSPTLRDKLANVQLALGQTILSIVIDNKTRWNSLYDCMTRFLELKPILISILPSEDLNDFDWDKVASICRTLKPLKECTLALQSNKSDAALAVKVIKFLNHLAHMEPALNSPIRTVLGKWIDNNPVITALINKSGSFFETIRKFAVEPESATQVASNDHQYVAVEESLSFAEFNNNCQLDEFDIFAFLENFRPSSVDPERLFSLCRLSRNYLQNRLSPENHSRNVFLNKNKRFLK